MTKPVARTIAAVVAIGVVCCVVVLIVAVHLPGGNNRPETGNVMPEGSPTVSALPGDISRNATPNQAPEEVKRVKNMTSKEVWERAQEIYASWYRSSTVERVLKEANMTPDELPDDVTEELKTTVQFEGIIRTWEFDPQNKQVAIYASPALNEEHEKELSAFQGRLVGGWTFNVVWEPYVPSFVRRALKEANMTPEELPDEVKEEMENISVQIGDIRKWELDPQNNRVTVHTYFSGDAKHEKEVQAAQGRQVAGWTYNVVQERYVPVAVRQALKEANMTPEELSDEVKEEMKNIVQSAEIGSIRTWELDPQNKQATVYVYSIPKENDVDAIQGKQVDGWTFTVIHDVNYEKEHEKDLEQLAAELMQLQKDHPELQISSFATSATEIDMWVFNRTPENEALNGTVMHNRTVLIYWSPVDYALRMAREEAGW